MRLPRVLEKKFLAVLPDFLVRLSRMVTHTYTKRAKESGNTARKLRQFLQLSYHNTPQLVLGSLTHFPICAIFPYSRAGVIRGRVVTSIGMGLVGVRVSTAKMNEGFTLTREDGWFDLLVNGGGAVTLQFGRSPFRPQTFIVNVPWNEVSSWNRFVLVASALLESS